MGNLHISKIKIMNFRNFENVAIETTNHNIIIGRNDVGKTNLFQALRYVFDSSSRPIEFSEYDVFEKDTSREISIEVTIKLGDINDSDTKIFLSEIAHLRKNEEQEFAICLKGRVDSEITLQWKPEGGNYETVPPYGTTRTKVDKIFSVFYIPPHIEVESQFRKFKNDILKEIEVSALEVRERQNIQRLNEDINNSIKQLESVKNVNSKLSGHLSEFQVPYDVNIESKLAVNNLHDNLEVFTKDSETDKIYPTAGDGRKKTVMYAMFNYHVSKDLRKIPIVLLEEPENHLFQIEQVRLSQTLFENKNYRNVFVSTHSPQLLYKVSDGSTVVRLVKKEAKTAAKSQAFNISKDQFTIMKSQYQQDLAHAIFVDKVLLVEGYSEKIVFDYILDMKCTSVESRSNRHILNIIGVDFEPYYSFLKGIGIDVYVKTDNDIKNKKDNMVELSGLNRLVNLLDEVNYIDQPGEIKPKDESTEEDLIKRKEYQEILYDESHSEIERLQGHNLHISQVDFENDLGHVLFENETEEKNIFIKKLQSSKWHKLYNHDVIFREESIEKILESELFSCLTNFINEDVNHE